MVKKFLVLIAGILIAGLIGFIGDLPAKDPVVEIRSIYDHAPLIVEFAKSEKSKQYQWGKGMVRHGIAFKTFYAKENTASHSNFDWTWTQHFLTIFYDPASEDIWVNFKIFAKDYQDFISPDSRGIVAWTFEDNDFDGSPDSIHRALRLIMQKDTVMHVSYPAEFVNTEWYTPTFQEGNERFNRELDFWTDLIKRALWETS